MKSQLREESDAHQSRSHRTGRRAVRRAVVWAITGACALPCHADTRSVRGVLEDAGLYFTAPLRWDQENWLEFGASIAAIGVAHELDDRTRSHFATGAGPGASHADPHDLRDLAPAAAILGGTWAAAYALDDRSGYEEGREMLEAGALSVATTELFKRAAGRLRPNESATPDSWRDGGDSFPSRHVSVTFAVGTILAESGGDDFRWVRRVLGYGLSAATAYTRMHENQHWLSDTVAGAALGIATAQFAMHRRALDGMDARLAITPLGDGVALAYTVRFN